MLVATFGPASGCAGRTITYEDGQFVHEVLGPVSAADVMGYDSMGWLVWPMDGMRAWVGSRAGQTPTPARRDTTSRDAPTRQEFRPTAPATEGTPRPAFRPEPRPEVRSEVRLPQRDPDRRYTKANPNPGAVWHIILEGSYTRIIGDLSREWRGTWCGKVVYDDFVITRALPDGARVCKLCDRFSASDPRRAVE